MKKLEVGMVALLTAAFSIASAQHGGKPTSPPPIQNQYHPTAPSQTPVAAHEKSTTTPEERAKAHSKKLTEKLGLNSEQEKSVYDFCLQRAKQDDTDKAKFQNDKEGMKSARKQNEDSFEKKLTDVLTADQKTKYEQFKQDEKEKRQKKIGSSK